MQVHKIKTLTLIQLYKHIHMYICMFVCICMENEFALGDNIKSPKKIVIEKQKRK